MQAESEEAPRTPPPSATALPRPVRAGTHSTPKTIKLKVKRVSYHTQPPCPLPGSPAEKSNKDGCRVGPKSKSERSGARRAKAGLGLGRLGTDGYVSMDVVRELGQKVGKYRRHTPQKLASSHGFPASTSTSPRKVTVIRKEKTLSTRILRTPSQGKHEG